MGQITLKQVRKSFGEVDVIPGVDLDINDGEFVVFVGPSGCGKSTLLRLIAGLEDTTSGTISIDGKDATALPPAKRGLAMVFQSYALYPHMSVKKNIAFPLKMAGMDPARAEEKVMAAAKVLNLASYLDRRPGQLSGGQRQRVAIGRAIVREPAAFLFDEPLSNLDAALRVGMRLEITELHQRLKTTMIYVTHDQVEAMTMADKIVVLNAGRVEQVGAPMELYNRPASEFVAGFIGAPAMNFLTVDLQDGLAKVEGVSLGAAPPGTVKLGIRPEHLILRPQGEGQLGATVSLTETLGGDAYLYVRLGLGGQSMVVRAEGDTALDHGATVGLDLPPTRLHHFAADGRTLASGGVAA